MNLRDRLEQIFATISELREAAADGPKSRQLVDSLFRTVHSFKAAALAENRDDLTKTAHDFENLLHSLRTGKIRLNDEVLRAIDETAAALREGSQSASLNLPKLNSETSTTDALPPEFTNLRDEERYRALAALREGSNLYVMEAVFEVSDFDERFRQLKERLEQDAELISTSPAMQED